MRIIIIFSLVGLIFCISSCSSESLKRTGYEALQNIGEQQCEKELLSECQERESYDDYQRMRKDAEDS
jgi:hypothetical protein